MMLDCKEASVVWALSPLRTDTRVRKCSSAKDWFRDLFNHDEKDRNGVGAFVAWANKATQQYWEFVHANEILNVNHASEGIGGDFWVPLQSGFLKINVDAAVDPDGFRGLGIVIRNHDGSVYRTACKRLEGDFEVDVTEALAARFGLEVAHDGGTNRIILETDNLKLFSHISKKHVERSSFGRIVADIFSLTCSFESFNCLHVRRSGNKVAHALAKLSLSCSSDQVWFEGYPSEIGTIVNSDFRILN
ncbi:uncharacterized protein LOC141588112 [Silene latifolia]|uniref:uncharacterized protein LOC141588112 n=1 Tax=Silene latifolia TaxID=37657 RepID=UPI003D7873A2